MIIEDILTQCANAMRERAAQIGNNLDDDLCYLDAGAWKTAADFVQNFTPRDKDGRLMRLDCKVGEDGKIG
jgi:hypothetical protein